jgi:hypothetical protein
MRRLRVTFPSFAGEKRYPASVDAKSSRPVAIAEVPVLWTLGR